MIKIMKKSTYLFMERELLRLRRVRPVADALEERGISAEDIRACRVHLHFNPGQRAKQKTS